MESISFGDDDDENEEGNTQDEPNKDEEEVVDLEPIKLNLLHSL